MKQKFEIEKRVGIEFNLMGKKIGLGFKTTYQDVVTDGDEVVEKLSPQVGIRVANISNTLVVSKIYFPGLQTADERPLLENQALRLGRRTVTSLGPVIE